MKNWIKNKKDGFYYEKITIEINPTILCLFILFYFIGFWFKIINNNNKIEIVDCLYKNIKKECIIYKLSNGDEIYSLHAFPDGDMEYFIHSINK